MELIAFEWFCESSTHAGVTAEFIIIFYTHSVEDNRWSWVRLSDLACFICESWYQIWNERQFSGKFLRNEK